LSLSIAPLVPSQLADNGSLLSPPKSLDEIHCLLPQFGWNVSQEELEKATSFLEKAGLVRNA